MNEPPLVLTDGEKVSSCGQKTLQHLEKELAKLREKNDQPMESDGQERTLLLAKIASYKEMTRWYEEKPPELKRVYP